MAKPMSNPRNVTKNRTILMGRTVAAKVAARLIEAGAPGLHFYALNRSWATREIFRNLGLRPSA